MKKTKETRRVTVGTEVECAVDRNAIINGDFHHDGSVSVAGNNRDDCDGSCQDDCECYYECECTYCQICVVCGDITDDCNCLECRICTNCNQCYEDCECDWKRSECNEKSEDVDENHHDCQACINYWIENHTTIDCYEADNHERNCEHDCDCECRCECNCYDGEDGTRHGQDGEIVSGILRENQLKGWFDGNEDAILKTNHTCGMHVHVGNIGHMEYGMLMSENFHDFLKAEVIKWGKEHKIKEDSALWKRLQGGNTYCRDSFKAEQQKMDTDKNSSRYCFINYCWALHGTIEIRLLPAFQKHELRYKAVSKVIDIIHTYLDNNKPKIHSLEIKEVV